MSYVGQAAIGILAIIFAGGLLVDGKVLLHPIVLPVVVVAGAVLAIRAGIRNYKCNCQAR